MNFGTKRLLASIGTTLLLAAPLHAATTEYADALPGTRKAKPTYKWRYLMWRKAFRRIAVMTVVATASAALFGGAATASETSCSGSVCLTIDRSPSARNYITRAFTYLPQGHYLAAGQFHYFGPAGTIDSWTMIYRPARGGNGLNLSSVGWYNYGVWVCGETWNRYHGPLLVGRACIRI